MYPGREPNEMMVRNVTATEEEKYGYHGCTVIIFRRIAVDYIYSANGARSQIPRREDLLTKATPRKADKLSIKIERHASTPTPS